MGNLLDDQGAAHGYLQRVGNRFSLKFKLFSMLLVVAVLLGYVGNLIFRTVFDSQASDAANRRADEISRLVSRHLDDPEALQRTLDGLVAGDDVRAVAVFEPGIREPFAESTDVDVSIPEVSTAGSDSHYVSLIGADSGESSSSVAETILVVELDRSVVAGDLRFGQERSIAGFVFGMIAVLLSAYLLVHLLVVRPLRTTSLALMRRSSLADDARHAFEPPIDEIASVRSAAAMAFDGLKRSDAGSETRSLFPPEKLPDITLTLDEHLAVLDSSVESQDEGSTESMSLNIQHVDELLSADVVEHIADTLSILNTGEEDRFEFSVGAQAYQARVRHNGNAFSLVVKQADAEIFTPESVSVEAASMLSDILVDLPFTVFEVDHRGIVRFANEAAASKEPGRSLVGRTVGDLVAPQHAADATTAIRNAIRTDKVQSFLTRNDRDGSPVQTMNHVVPVEFDRSVSAFVVGIPNTGHSLQSAASSSTKDLEEKVWELEIKVSGYEEEIEQIRQNSYATEHVNGTADERMTQVLETLSANAAAARSSVGDLLESELPRRARDAAESVASSLRDLVGVIEDETGRSSQLTESQPLLRETSQFHLGTLLDEIAISLGSDVPGEGARVSVMVHPSLPKTIVGNEQIVRVAIVQMVEYARLVAPDRAYLVSATQDESSGSSLQVRFELQIPAPRLTSEERTLLEQCLDGDVDAKRLSTSFQEMIGESQLYRGMSDIEMVVVGREMTILRWSGAFQTGGDADDDHGWIRGLRTLIIQPDQTGDSGVQDALSAFGIIGYIVSDADSLVEALKVAEEYSNPYRIVLADVETQNLEGFVGQLFDGEAPVVLIGNQSEAAIVSAISAGYSGYIAKPVRKIDLLEVILSTVDPVGAADRFDEAISAA